MRVDFTSWFTNFGLQIGMFKTQLKKIMTELQNFHGYEKYLLSPETGRFKTSEYKFFLFFIQGENVRKQTDLLIKFFTLLRIPYK